MRNAFGLTLAALALGCSSTPRTFEEAVASTPATCDVPAQLRAAADGDVNAEVTKAINARRLRFIGVRGYALEVPGLTREEQRCVQESKVVDPIEGTSDMILCEEHYSLQNKAIAFAKGFNLAMRAEWAKRSMKPCGV